MKIFYYFESYYEIPKDFASFADFLKSDFSKPIVVNKLEKGSLIPGKILIQHRELVFPVDMKKVEIMRTRHLKPDFDTFKDEINGFWKSFVDHKGYIEALIDQNAIIDPGNVSEAQKLVRSLFVHENVFKINLYQENYKYFLILAAKDTAQSKIFADYAISLAPKKALTNWTLTNQIPKGVLIDSKKYKNYNNIMVAAKNSSDQMGYDLNLFIDPSSKLSINDAYFYVSSLLGEEIFTSLITEFAISTEKAPDNAITIEEFLRVVANLQLQISKTPTRAALFTFPEYLTRSYQFDETSRPKGIFRDVFLTETYSKSFDDYLLHLKPNFENFHDNEFHALGMTPVSLELTIQYSDPITTILVSQLKNTLKLTSNGRLISVYYESKKIHLNMLAFNYQRLKDELLLFSPQFVAFHTKYTEILPKEINQFNFNYGFQLYRKIIGG